MKERGFSFCQAQKHFTLSTKLLINKKVLGIEVSSIGRNEYPISNFLIPKFYPCSCIMSNPVRRICCKGVVWKVQNIFAKCNVFFNQFMDTKTLHPFVVVGQNSLH